MQSNPVMTVCCAWCGLRVKSFAQNTERSQDGLICNIDELYHVHIEGGFIHCVVCLRPIGKILGNFERALLYRQSIRVRVWAQVEALPD